MDFTNNQHLENLIVEDGELMVIFTFPNEERKIRCSRAMLCEVSEVFKTMFCAKWDCQNENVPVKLNDLVSFDQFQNFKLFVQILYGIRSIESLSGIDASCVFFYSDKYDVKSVSHKILAWITSQLRRKITLNELVTYIEFAKTYPALDDFANKLELVKLDLNERDAMKFFDLAMESGMCLLQQQITGYMKTIPPSNDWSKEALQAVIKDLQMENNSLAAERKARVEDRPSWEKPLKRKSDSLIQAFESKMESRKRLNENM